MDSTKRSVQALDPSSGVWLPARTCGAINGESTLVKWRDYSEKTSVLNHKIRHPQPKEKCLVDKDLWPNFGHPDKLQRGDLVNFKSDTAKEKFLVVEENDPFRAEITSSCGQLLGYNAIVEGTIYSLSHEELNEAGLPLPAIVPPSTTVLSLSSKDNLTNDDQATITVEKEGKQKRKRGKEDKENKRKKSDSRSSQKEKKELKKQKDKKKEKKASKTSESKDATTSKTKVMVKKKSAEMILVGGGAAAGGTSCDKTFTYNSSTLAVGEKELEDLLRELQTSGKTVRLASSFWDNSDGAVQSHEVANIAQRQTPAPEHQEPLEDGLVVLSVDSGQTGVEAATLEQRQAQAPAPEVQEPLRTVSAVPSVDSEKTSVEVAPVAQRQTSSPEGHVPPETGLVVSPADSEKTKIRATPIAQRQASSTEGHVPPETGLVVSPADSEKTQIDSTPIAQRQASSTEGNVPPETGLEVSLGDSETTPLEAAPLASKQIHCHEGQEPLPTLRASGLTSQTARQVTSPEGEVSKIPSLNITGPTCTEMPGYVDEDSFADDFNLFDMLGDGEQVNDKLLGAVKDMHEDLKIMKTMFKTMLTEMKGIKEALNILPPLQEGPLFSDDVLEVVETENGQYYKVRETVLNDLLPFNSDPPTIARRLADTIFTQEERLNSNVKGVKGKLKLNVAKVFAIRKALEQLCNVEDREKMWAKAVKAIDSASRYLKFKTAL